MLRTSPSDQKCGYSPVEIETGMQPRSPIATSQGLVRLKHQASERQTREHMIELTSLREEVYEASERAAQYIKEHFDSKTSTWKDEDLLKPGVRI